MPDDSTRDLIDNAQALLKKHKEGPDAADRLVQEADDLVKKKGARAPEAAPSTRQLVVDAQKLVDAHGGRGAKKKSSVPLLVAGLAILALVAAVVVFLSR
jgi:hypothetical protein